MTKTLLAGGSVFTADPNLGDLPVADVLIDGDRIEAVGRDLPRGDAEVVDVSGQVVMPGLVDTHRHMWQSSIRQIATDWALGEYVEKMLGKFGPKFRPEDVRAANHLGGLEAIDGGVTTVMDWSHIMNTPEHADAAIDGHEASGIRVVFGYGAPSSPVNEWYPDDVRRIARDRIRGGNSLVSLALSSLGPEFANFEEAEADIRLARELGIRTSIHLGVGLLGSARSITGLDERGLLGDDLIFVHCSTCSDEEIARIAATGGHVSIAARVEMHMGHGYPVTGKLVSAGIRPGLSIDVVTGVTGSLFSEMRGTLEAERGRQNQTLLERGEWTQSLDLTGRAVIEMATIGGAETLGLSDQIGSITPGKQADIITLDMRSPSLSFVNDLTGAILASDWGNVDSVYIAGSRRKVDGRLVDDPVAAQLAARSSRDYLLG
jgi:5-methylthioadenosine/S-adenosylhomocysteine deaminase